MNIDWKRKLTSRKWWMSVIAFITGLILAFGGNDNLVATVSGVIMSLASCIAYTIAEGFVDAQSVKSQNQADVMKSMTDMITTSSCVSVKEDQNDKDGNS